MTQLGGTDAGTRGTILVVDDEANVARAYGRILRQAGFGVQTLTDPTAVRGVLQAGGVDVVVTDLRMRGDDGIAVLRAAREEQPDLPVIILTGNADLPSAIQAIEHGAFRFLEKPIQAEALIEVTASAVGIGTLTRLKRRAYELFGRTVSLGPNDLERRFTAALQSVRMAYQPVIRWSTRTVEAHEALVRTDEPSLRRPDDLFAAAEHLGALPELGRTIRRQVAETFATRADGRVLVNVHPNDLDDPDLYDPASSLARLAERVTLELTERASLEQIADVAGRVRRLRELGFRIAVDDLGAGYAGLSSFATLSPEVVKLDMTLTRGIDADPTKRKLVQSLTSLCRELSITVVAEGVETIAERDTLISLGCDLLQGYLFAAPGDLSAPIRF